MCSDDPDYVESNPYEEELVRVADNMWKDYQESYVPLENTMIDRIQGYGSQEHKDQQVDKAVTAARINTPGQVTAGAGMDPSNGNFAAASGAAQNQTGLSGAMGAMSGQQTAEDQYIGGMMGLAQMGRGQQATAMQGTSHLASMTAGQQAAELAAKQTIESAKWGAGGSLAGLGMVYGNDKYKWFKPKPKPDALTNTGSYSTGVWQDLG